MLAQQRMDLWADDTAGQLAGALQGKVCIFPKTSMQHIPVGQETEKDFYHVVIGVGATQCRQTEEPHFLSPSQDGKSKHSCEDF